MENKVDIMLTTVDNPYDPFEDFKLWYLFDMKLGYNTCGYIARLAKDDESMTQKEKEKDVEEVIDRIIACDPFNVYIKVTKPSEEEPEDTEDYPIDLD